jgi:hypothetical protein
MFSRNQDAVTERDDTTRRFPRRRIALEWIIVNALLHLEVPFWPRGVSRFVNVRRHMTTYSLSRVMHVQLQESPAKKPRPRMEAGSCEVVSSRCTVLRAPAVAEHCLSLKPK